jgi:hypothetical protein
MSGYLTDMGVSVNWEKIEHWEKLDDSRIFTQTTVFPEALVDDELVIVVTDSDFNEPSVKSKSELTEFIENYHGSKSCCFYDGDTIIVSETKKYLYMFSHEGAYANVSW